MLSKCHKKRCMHLKVKSIIQMTIDGYNLRVLNTELHIRYTNTKYSSMYITIPFGEWLVCFPFDSCIQGSSRVGRNFIFQKKKPTETCLPFRRLNGHWMVTEMRLKSTFPVTINSPFSHHSVYIQSKEMWVFILWCSVIVLLRSFIRFSSFTSKIDCRLLVSAKMTENLNMT